MIIGLIPGAMKPYHAGHHFLTEIAISQCDQVFIFTTVRDRGPVSGLGMYDIWNEIIIPLLPSKVSVSFTGSPVTAVYDILEEEQLTPTNKNYRLYGGTEDLGRFANEYIQEKFPNVADRFTNVAESSSVNYLRGVGKSPMAKGSWVRDAIKTGNLEKFTSMLPKFLQHRAQDIFNMLN